MKNIFVLTISLFSIACIQAGHDPYAIIAECQACLRHVETMQEATERELFREMTHKEKQEYFTNKQHIAQAFDQHFERMINLQQQNAPEQQQQECKKKTLELFIKLIRAHESLKDSRLLKCLSDISLTES